MSLMVTSLVVVSLVAFLFGVGLAFAGRKLAVAVDERVLLLKDALPGINCGACGYAGCQDYANAMVHHDAPANKCSPGGPETVAKLSAILGKSAEAAERRVVKVLCLGGKNEATWSATYRGVPTCAAASLTGGGKDCPFGCLGYGDCAAVCPFDALHMSDDRLPVVDEEKCTGCGQCVRTCPRAIIQFAPLSAYLSVNCRSTDRGPEVAKYCKVGCIGCGLCVKAANGQGIRLERNLAVVDYAAYKGDGTPAEKCPKKTIVFQKEKYERLNPSRSA